MHQPRFSSNFVKPGGSRPIPIIDPVAGPLFCSSPPASDSSQTSAGHSLSRQGPVPGTGPAQSLSRAGPEGNGLPEPNVTGSMQSQFGERHVGRHVGANDGTSASPGLGIEEEFARGFDVYATPFVPEKLRSINLHDGKRMETPPKKIIDFGAYAINSLGPGLLPAISPPADPSPSEQEWLLKTRNYERYFHRHLETEFSYQEQENASCSLYAHPADLDFSPNPNEPAVTISVPGLRENSPYLEEDDVVELRQLRADGMGLLIDRPDCANGWNAISPSYRPKPWTGLIFHARVMAVLRAKEEIILRVSGLTHHASEVIQALPPYTPLPAQARLKFNVQFPVPRDRYLPMEHVLPQIQAALTAASDITYRSQDSFGESQPQAAQENQFWVQSMLFPTQADCEIQSNLHTGNFSMQFFDQAINWEQRKAVENICSQNYGVLPYLISGPPGTGKTKALIETALQLMRSVEGVSHILMCAPSEPASDTLASRLRVHMAPHELLRLNRPSRSFAEVPDALLPYCCVSGDTFSLPPFAQLMQYKIVVTSCRDASMLMHARMTNSDLYAVEYGLRSRIHPSSPPPPEASLHWDALLMDEAAQATEPQSLVPLFVVAPPRESPRLRFTPLFAMAGDEHQLGPRTATPTATPLKRSLFARLFALPVYAEHPLARGRSGARQPPPLRKSMLPILRPAFTNLVCNYRSHPAILAVPSHLFYHDTLEPEVGDDADRLAAWEGWQGRRWPVLFHHCRALDDLERDSGGWYNAGEAEVACSYAARLAASGLVEQEEICIMSPFKAQVRRLRKMIRGEGYGLWGVNVGPTEAFQGLERGVVILCVTRARRRFVEKDRSLGWGIVGMPNEMNVALTRAKFGLIVVGRRAVLGEDANWKTVLDFCDRNGLVAGEGEASNPEANSEPDRLTRIEKVLTARDGAQNGSFIPGTRYDAEFLFDRS